MVKDLLSSKEAALKLGVKVPTLYAYVSRGLLPSEPGRDSRSRLYRRADVEALKRQVELKRDPARAAATALDWGTPVLDSELTMIRDGTYYYRGLEVPPHIGEWTLEQVAALLWCDDLDGAEELFAATRVPFPPEWRRLLARLPGGHPSDRMQHVLRFLAAQDPGASEVRLDLLPVRGARLLVNLAGSLSERRIGAGGRVGECVGRGLGGRPCTGLLARCRDGGVCRSRTERFFIHGPVCRLGASSSLRHRHGRTGCAARRSARRPQRSCRGVATGSGGRQREAPADPSTNPGRARGAASERRATSRLSSAALSRRRSALRCIDHAASQRASSLDEVGSCRRRGGGGRRAGLRAPDRRFRIGHGRGSPGASPRECVRSVRPRAHRWLDRSRHRAGLSPRSDSSPRSLRRPDARERRRVNRSVGRFTKRQDHRAPAGACLPVEA